MVRLSDLFIFLAIVNLKEKWNTFIVSIELVECIQLVRSEYEITGLEKEVNDRDKLSDGSNYYLVLLHIFFSRSVYGEWTCMNSIQDITTKWNKHCGSKMDWRQINKGKNGKNTWSEYNFSIDVREIDEFPVDDTTKPRQKEWKEGKKRNTWNWVDQRRTRQAKGILYVWQLMNEK